MTTSKKNVQSAPGTISFPHSTNSIFVLSLLLLWWPIELPVKMGMPFQATALLENGQGPAIVYAHTWSWSTSLRNAWGKWGNSMKQEATRVLSSLVWTVDCFRNEENSDFSWKKIPCKRHTSLWKHETKRALERFSNDCRKPKTKAITPTNHNRNEQHYEPITVPSNYPQLAQSAGKITRTWCDWFWLYFSLVEKLARVYLANH